MISATSVPRSVPSGERPAVAEEEDDDASDDEEEPLGRGTPLAIPGEMPFTFYPTSSFGALERARGPIF